MPSCSASADLIATASASHRRVEPSTSVNRNVTVPDGPPTQPTLRPARPSRSMPPRVNRPAHLDDRNRRELMYRCGDVGIENPPAVVAGDGDHNVTARLSSGGPDGWYAEHAGRRLGRRNNAVLPRSETTRG